MKQLGLLLAALFCLTLAFAEEAPQLETTKFKLLPIPASLREVWLVRIGTETPVGICLLGTPQATHSGGLQFSFFSERLKHKTQSGLWIGWYGELENQYGMQIAVLNEVHGQSVTQLAAGANYATELNGLQAAGLVNLSPEMNGMQAAGLGNITEEANGLQLAVLLNQAEQGSGVQIALFNVTGVPLDQPEMLNEPTEQKPGFVVQLGLENYSVNRKVFQLGLYNDKSEPGFQIGLVNRSDTGFFTWMPFFNW